MLAFRSLDPFRALREPDRRRRDEERLSRSEQRTLSKTQNNHLTGKAPYQVRIPFPPAKSPVRTLEGWYPTPDARSRDSARNKNGQTCGANTAAATASLASLVQCLSPLRQSSPMAELRKQHRANPPLITTIFPRRGYCRLSAMSDDQSPIASCIATASAHSLAIIRDAKCRPTGTQLEDTRGERWLVDGHCGADHSRTLARACART